MDDRTIRIPNGSPKTTTPNSAVMVGSPVAVRIRASVPRIAEALKPIASAAPATLPCVSRPSTSSVTEASCSSTAAATPMRA